MDGWVATPRNRTPCGPGRWPFTGLCAGEPSTRELGTLGPWGHPPASPLPRGVVFSLLTLSVLIA